MTARPGPSETRSALLVARGVFIELVRRKDLYVLGLLVGCFALAMTVVRGGGIEQPSTGTFLLNLGMTLAVMCAHILTLLLAVRQFPQEIEGRTLHPLLARPLERRTLVLGKWFACALGGFGALLILLLLGVAPVPRMETYDTVLLVQFLLLQAGSLAMLAALGIGLSLVVNKALLIVVLGALVFLGGRIGPLFEHMSTGTVQAVGGWLVAYLPDFSKFNLVTRYTDGIGPVPWLQWAGLAAYALLFTVLGLTVGVRALQRRVL